MTLAHPNSRTPFILALFLLLSFPLLAQKTVKVSFLNQKVKALLLSPAQATEDDKDAAIVERLSDILKGGAEEAPTALNANVLLSEWSVQSKFLVFGLELPEAQTLHLQLLNNETFVTVFEGDLQVPDGGRFYAVPTKTLKSGLYRLKITRADGAELNRRIPITKE